MVTHDPRGTGSRYLADATGAPPIPPPGGYRGAARQRGAARDDEITIPGAERRRDSAFGWVVLITTFVFALVLLVMSGLASPQTIFAGATLAVQALVTGLLIAGLASPAARRLAGVALAVALVFNVGTMGAVSSARSTGSGSGGTSSTADDAWAGYPGIKDVSPSLILSQPSLEEVTARNDAVLAAVRDALSAEFGFTWAEPVPGSLSPVRNGYGGESMLQTSTSQTWSTEQTLTSLDQKLAVMDTIDAVIAEYSMYSIRSLNSPASGLDSTLLDKLYGGTTVETQPVWEWYSSSSDGVARLYATVYDLSLDADGRFADQRQAAHERTGEPVEGLQLMFVTDSLLSENDVDEFTERLKDYP